MKNIVDNARLVLHPLQGSIIGAAHISHTHTAYDNVAHIQIPKCEYGNTQYKIPMRSVNDCDALHHELHTVTTSHANTVLTGTFMPKAPHTMCMHHPHD